MPKPKKRKKKYLVGLETVDPFNEIEVLAIDKKDARRKALRYMQKEGLDIDYRIMDIEEIEK